MGILLLLGDRALFMANESKDSLVTVMILLQQLSLVVTIILGKLFFREKHIIYRLFCAALVISGIVISTL
jgi:drug/metabolite transporter (DMT)-like permease